MLTIREPIKPRFSIGLTINESLANRMKANYEQLNTDITATDLMHVLTMPPEIYYGEGDYTSIIYANNNIANINEQKVEIINNLINRIMLAANNELTYQDRVYISNTLNKLGIRDERRFLEQVINNMRRTDEINRVINQIDNRTEITNIRQNIMEQAINNQNVNEDNVVTKEDILYLHNDITNRLQTNEIYNELQSFFNSTNNTNELDSIQVSNLEQYNLSQISRVNEYINEPEKMTLIHQENNLYEAQEDVLNLTNEQMTNRITEAALTSVINKVYQYEVNNNTRPGSIWMQVSNALYSVADNTINRIEQNIVNPVSTTLYETEVTAQEIINNLNFYNEENKKRVELYNQAIEQYNLKLADRKPVDEARVIERTLRESLAGLDNPEAVREHLQLERAFTPSRDERQWNEAMEAMPDVMRRRLELLHAVTTGGVGLERIEGDEAIKAATAEFTSATREFVQPIEHVEEIINREQEDLTRVLNLVNRQVSQTNRVNKLYNEEINLIHKTADTINEEEILERLEEQKQLINANRQVVTTTKENVTEVNNITTTKQIVHDEIQELDITNMIQRNVRRELDGYSNQIFEELEERLDDERKRRGL